MEGLNYVGAGLIVILFSPLMKKLMGGVHYKNICDEI